MSSKEEDESAPVEDQKKESSPASNVPRYPHSGGRAPEGYYQPVYPPPPGDGTVPPYPPPRGYEGGPYGIPPPHMPGGYPMYPYQPHMYSHYPGYPPPPMYGYPPPDPNMGYGPRGDEEGRAGYPKKDDESKMHDDDDDDSEDDESEDIVPGAVTARLKTYIKPRIPTTQDVLDRRARKNAQSRSRAAKLRLRVIEIEKKAAEERTEEEQAIFLQFENRRNRKNDRSRERALEKKEEIDRILAKPEKKRTKIEKQFLDNALNSKKRKNEGDRTRRQRLKVMGVPAKVGLKHALARGAHMPPPPAHYHPYPPPYGGHMGEIPMSPMPQMGVHHHMASPGGFGSPGMMSGMGYPSPQHRRGPPGVMETPVRPSMPYMPPSQSYESQGSPPNYQPHIGGPGSRVEQRRHADGSLSISIGGGGGASGNGNGSANGTASDGNEDRSGMNISSVADLLLYDGEDDAPPTQGQDDSSPTHESKHDD